MSVPTWKVESMYGVKGPKLPSFKPAKIYDSPIARILMMFFVFKLRSLLDTLSVLALGAVLDVSCIGCSSTSTGLAIALQVGASSTVVVDMLGVV